MLQYDEIHDSEKEMYENDCTSICRAVTFMFMFHVYILAIILFKIKPQDKSESRDI